MNSTIFLLFLGILLPSLIYSLSPTVGNVYPFIPTSSPGQPNIFYFGELLSIVQDSEQNVYLSNDGLTWNQLNGVQANQIYINNNTILFQLVDYNGQNTETILSYYNIVTETLSNETFDGIYSPISQHPKQTDLLVTVVKFNNTFSNVQVSTDFGETWKVISIQGETVKEVPVWDISNNSGLFVMGVDSTTSNSLYYTLDFGVTVSLLIGGVYQFIHSNYLHYWALTSSGLFLVSSTSGNKQVTLLSNGVANTNYTSLVILDDNVNNGAYIAAYEAGSLATVYQYDGNDGVFDQVFEGIFVQNYFADFMPLQSTPGYYALNAETTVNNDTFFTYYTIDNGANWNQFIDGNGEVINFFGYVSFGTNQIAPLYGSPLSLGITIGNGVNAPIVLDENMDNATNTYLSRDSGYTWTAIFPGPTMYEFGNYANFLVLVPKVNPSNLVFYSIDQGETFQNLTLPEEIINGNFNIYNIFTDIQVPQQLVFTFLYLNDTSEAMFSIDFKTLNYPICDNPDFENVDLYGNSSVPETSCVDGTVTQYYRRKQTSKCLSEFAPELTGTNACNCTYDDFECDIGYFQIKGSKTLNCTRAKGTPLPQPPANCPSGTNYTMTKGYKRIFGDICTGGISSQLDPTIVQCPTSSSSETNTSSSSQSSQSQSSQSQSSQSQSSQSQSSQSQSSQSQSSQSQSSQSHASQSSNENTGGSTIPTTGTNTGGTTGSIDGSSMSGNTGDSNSFTSGSLDGSSSTTGSISDSSSNSESGSSSNGKNSGKSGSSTEKPKKDHKGLIIGLIITFIIVVVLIVGVMYRYPNLRVKISKLFRGSEFTYSKLTNDSDYLIYEDGDDEEQ